MHIAFLLLLSLLLARGDEGVGIDPNGGIYAAGGGAMDPNGDTGSCIDPNGGPCVRALGDDGSGLDPHGGRRLKATGDYTACVDPNG